MRRHPCPFRHHDNYRLIGSGNIGSTVARLAVAAGYDVVLSNSRGPETLSDLVDTLGPRARAAMASEAAEAADIAVVTVPLKNYRRVPVEALRGKVVIDTNNYYPDRDGHIAELDDESTTTSELLQAHLPSPMWSRGSTTSTSTTWPHSTARREMRTGRPSPSLVMTQRLSRPFPSSSMQSGTTHTTSGR